jgi:hypothetical protein
MTAPAKPGAALTATLNANEKRYARTSAARNRARQRECVDGYEFTVDELAAERDARSRPSAAAVTRSGSDDRVPVVRFAPVRRRVPDRPYPGAAMTWLLVIPAVLLLLAVVVVGYMEWLLSKPLTPRDKRLSRVDQELTEREELARERAYRSGPRGWTF